MYNWCCSYWSDICGRGLQSSASIWREEVLLKLEKWNWSLETGYRPGEEEVSLGSCLMLLWRARDNALRIWTIMSEWPHKKWTLCFWKRKRINSTRLTQSLTRSQEKVRNCWIWTLAQQNMCLEHQVIAYSITGHTVTEKQLVLSSALALKRIFGDNLPRKEAVKRCCWLCLRHTSEWESRSSLQILFKWLFRQ